MYKLRFHQVSSKNHKACKVFRKLMIDYAKELDRNQNRKTNRKIIKKWTESIIDIQWEAGRHLELCFDGKHQVGFLYGKIDRPGQKGYIRPGWGYIMEFYVRPEYRRNGYGKAVYKHLENLFRTDGAESIYLTADPVTGKPFWEAMGFINSGIKSSENGMDIYEKILP